MVSRSSERRSGPNAGADGSIVIGKIMEEEKYFCGCDAQAGEYGNQRRLAGDAARSATSGEVKDLRRKAAALKEVVVDLTLENRLLKKSINGDGEDEA
jgi:hypothetical protein